MKPLHGLTANLLFCFYFILVFSNAGWSIQIKLGVCIYCSCIYHRYPKLTSFFQVKKCISLYLNELLGKQQDNSSRSDMQWTNTIFLFSKSIQKYLSWVCFLHATQEHYTVVLCCWWYILPSWGKQPCAIKKKQGGDLVEFFPLLLLYGADQATTSYQGEENATQLRPLCPHFTQSNPSIGIFVYCLIVRTQECVQGLRTVF